MTRLVDIFQSLIERMGNYYEKHPRRFITAFAILISPCAVWVGTRVGKQFGLIDFVIFGALYVLSFTVTMLFNKATAYPLQRLIDDSMPLSKDVFEMVVDRLKKGSEINEYLYRVYTGELDVQRVKHNDQWEIKFVPRQQKRLGGRPRGSLSSGALPAGTTIDDILPFLRQAKAARDNQDGSFTRLCGERDLPESTVRGWLDNYADKI